MIREIVDDAIKVSEIAEFKLPKVSITGRNGVERDARYYKYDKSGRLTSVEYTATPEKNEYYKYDRQGNIVEKQIGGKVYKYTYDSGNQLMAMETPEGKREYFYDMAGRIIMKRVLGNAPAELPKQFVKMTIPLKVELKEPSDYRPNVRRKHLA